jgi:GTP-binding protein
MIFTDLPGYGFAKISREVSARWPEFIEPYLKERPNLSLCVSLVDASVPPQPSDQQLIEFLQTSGREFLIVATKSDRLSGNQLQNSLRTLTQAFSSSNILPFSARTGAGKSELWQAIRKAMEAR